MMKKVYGILFFTLMIFIMLNLLVCHSSNIAKLTHERYLDIEEFTDAISFLHYYGDRAKAADMFAEIVQKYPNSEYANKSQELVNLLRKMVEEGKNWKEPEDISKLSMDEQIAYWVYKLRDVNFQTCLSPGYTRFLDQESHPRARKDGFKHAGWELLEIGKPAIPTLINLLNDRRPTRTVGYRRWNYPSRTIQRYQDAALEILEKILNKKFYGEEGYRSNYFSELSAEHRQKIIAEIKVYWEKSKEKPNNK